MDKKTTKKTLPQKAANKRPDGSISAKIFTQIEQMTASGKMKRSEAFRQLAQKTGRKEGTVAVNYYYAAKKQGGGKSTRPATTPINTGARRPYKTPPVKIGTMGGFLERIEQDLIMLQGIAKLLR